MSQNKRILRDQLELQVRWSDMDAMGHVNNSVFFTYFEQARIEWWKRAKIPSLSFKESGPVIVTANCTFLKPIIYPETLLIKTFTGPAGRSSFECFYEVTTLSHPEILHAEGNTKVVWINRENSKSTPLPDYLLQLLK
jgi:acyl-CoA thioester hydrolase